MKDAGPVDTVRLSIPRSQPGAPDWIEAEHILPTGYMTWQSPTQSISTSIRINTQASTNPYNQAQPGYLGIHSLQCQLISNKESKAKYMLSWDPRPTSLSRAPPLPPNHVVASEAQNTLRGLQRYLTKRRVARREARSICTRVGIELKQS